MVAIRVNDIQLAMLSQDISHDDVDTAECRFRQEAQSKA